MEKSRVRKNSHTFVTLLNHPLNREQTLKRTRANGDKHIWQVEHKVDDARTRCRKPRLGKEHRNGKRHGNGRNHKHLQEDKEQQRVGVGDDLAPHKNDGQQNRLLGGEWGCG